MKKAIYLIIFLISLYIINSFVHSIYNLSQKKYLIINTREELEREKEEHARLTNELTLVKRQDYIEEEARNKLFLVQPGETLVVIPSPPQISSEAEKRENIDHLPIWKQWVYTFFGPTS